MTGAMVKADESSVLAQYSSEQVDILRKHIAGPSFTDNELAFCMSVARARNLDPFQRQIYFTKRGSNVNGQWVEKVNVEPTIDGFRVIASRTGESDGTEDPLWCGPDGVWRDVWLEKAPPAAAKMTVYRKGQRKPHTAIARFDEYAQRKKDGSLTSMWLKMPANQLSKCAEARAYRKAFPEQFSGMYSHEEMGQADNAGDRFAALAQEARPVPAPVAEEHKPKVIEAPKVKRATLPPLPDSVTHIPPEIIKIVAPWKELIAVPFDKMHLEDLELVQEQARRLRSLPMTSAEGKAWMTALEGAAKHRQGELEAMGDDSIAWNEGAVQP